MGVFVSRIEGKIANQMPKYHQGSGRGTVVNKCSCCNKEISSPHSKYYHDHPEHFSIWSYVGTDHFIYESSCGNAVTYCSKTCAKKHNHRFRTRYITKFKDIKIKDLSHTIKIDDGLDEN